MTQDKIQLNSDGTGKKLDAWITASASQYRQVFIQGDPSVDANVVNVLSATVATVTPNMGATELAFMYGQVNASISQPIKSDGNNNLNVNIQAAATLNVGNILAVSQSGAPWTANVSIQGNLPVTATLATLSVGNLINAIATVTGGDLTSGNQQTKITDGTNIANVLKSDGTAAGQNAVLVAGSHLTVAFTTTTAQAVGTTDVADYAWVSVHPTSQGGSSTINFQGSNDNINWVTVSLARADGINTSPASSTASTSFVWSGPLGFRYFRLNITGIISGTTAGVIEFFTQSKGIVSAGGSVTVGSNSATGSAVPANSFYMGLNGTSGNLTGAVSAGQASAQAASSAGILAAAKYSYNLTNQDEDRNNITGAVIAAGATTTQTSAAVTTYNASKLKIIINISAFTSGTLTFTINGQTSSSYTYTIGASAALGSTGVTTLTVFPGATAAANAAFNDMLPRSFTVTVTGTFVATYGVDYILSV